MILVLSIDGGGVRGVLTAKLLERIEAERPFLRQVDVFAGTSVGGVLALALACGEKPDRIIRLFQEKATKIFGKRDWLDSVSKLDELVRADFDNVELKAALQEIFGERSLKSVPKNVLIPTFDLDNEGEGGLRFWKPKFLHNFMTPGNDGAVKIVDACLRTGAAPTYFPTYQGYVDGGVVCNTPSMAAIAKVCKAGFRLEDIYLFSIGTGFNPQYIEGDRLDWGFKQWLDYLLAMLFEGMAGVPDYQATQLLGSRYHRIDVPLNEVIALDAADRIDDLLQIGELASIDATVTWLQKEVPVLS